MGNMVRARVRVKGVRPLLWHWFGPDALPLEKGEKVGVAGNDPSEWRKTVTVTKDGQLFVPASYVFGCIREGGKNIKRSRASIYKMIASTLQIEEERVLLDRFWPGFPNGHSFGINEAEHLPRDSEEPVYLDVRGVVNPSTKGRNVRYRVAASPGWQAEFSVIWDKTIVSRGEMEAATIDGGKLSGIGNGRAIGMGRYEVVSFEVEEV